MRAHELAVGVVQRLRKVINPWAGAGNQSPIAGNIEDHHVAGVESQLQESIFVFGAVCGVEATLTPSDNTTSDGPCQCRDVAHG